MGYDLHPRNKNIEVVSVGGMSWPFFLQDSGAGYVLGYGQNMVAGSYVYQQGNSGSPVSNDGYSVTSFEAKAMAKCFRGFVSVQRFVNDRWKAYPEEERERMKKETYNGVRTYRGEYHEDHMVKMEQIADFMEKSQGFKIY